MSHSKESIVNTKGGWYLAKVRPRGGQRAIGSIADTKKEAHWPIHQDRQEQQPSSQGLIIPQTGREVSKRNAPTAVRILTHPKG